jgi:hypothetical protein
VVEALPFQRQRINPKQLSTGLANGDAEVGVLVKFESVKKGETWFIMGWILQSCSGQSAAYFLDLQNSHYAC